MIARARTALEQLWSERVRAWPTALLAGAGALALYLATLGRHVSMSDPAEFQTLAATGGIAHSGYPTVVLLLQALGELPFGTLAWRANLLSALSGAIAVAWLAWLAHRWTGRAAAALAAAAVFAAGVAMWRESTHAGVHAFTLALDATLFVIALRFAHEPRVWLAAAAGLLFGIGITCHLTVLGLGLPLLLAFAVGAPRLARWRWAVALAVLGLALGLTPFAYTLSVDRPEQPMNYLHDTLEPGQASFAVERPDQAQRVQRLAWLLSGRQYLDVDRREPHRLARRAGYVALVLVVNDLPLVAFALALVGLVLVCATRGIPGRCALAWFASAVMLAGVGGTELTLDYFFLPATWLLALGLSAALAPILRRSMLWGSLAMAAVLAGPVARHTLAGPPPPIDGFAMGRYIWRVTPEEWDPFHESLRFDEYGRGVMQRLPARAVVLAGRWGESMTLRYFVHGEALRPDVTVRLSGARDPRLSRHWHEAMAEGRPVFLTQEPAPGSLPDARLERVWDSGWQRLWRAWPAAR